MTVRAKALSSGPIAIYGLDELVQADGCVHDLREREKVLLCGCGHSENRPFCTGAHNRFPLKKNAPSASDDES